MGSLTIKDSRLSGATLVPDEFIDFYMPRANGEFVKIYLYLLRSVHGRDFDPSLSHLADVFSCTEKDILRALRYWEKAGLVSLTFRGKDRELEKIELLPIKPNLTITQVDPAEKKPEETAPAVPEENSAPAQISSSRLRQLKESKDVQTILMFTERYLGKPLSNTDMRRILYFYDELHFPVDLIDYLVDYCVSHGGRNMNYIEKVGLAWKEEGLTTVKAAKEHASVYQNKYFAIFRAFGIRNRNPIPDETRTMDRWLDEYGFSIDIIKNAAARTVKQTGQPSFPYAERILSEWHKAGVRGPEDIERLDRQHMQEREQRRSENAGSASGKAKKSGNSTNFNSNFHQRDYDFDKLESELLKNQV